MRESRGVASFFLVVSSSKLHKNDTDVGSVPRRSRNLVRWGGGQRNPWGGSARPSSLLLAFPSTPTRLGALGSATALPVPTPWRQGRHSGQGGLRAELVLSGDPGPLHPPDMVARPAKSRKFKGGGEARPSACWPRPPLRRPPPAASRPASTLPSCPPTGGPDPALICCRSAAPSPRSTEALRRGRPVWGAQPPRRREREGQEEAPTGRGSRPDEPRA